MTYHLEEWICHRNLFFDAQGGPGYRKWPNGRRVAKATRTKYRKNHTEHRATAAAGRGATATGQERTGRGAIKAILKTR